MAAIMVASTAMAAEYKVGILQFVDDASLNQIEAAIEAELDAKSAEGEDTFVYEGNVYNGQADSTTLNQMTSQMIADGVDVIIPIATPAAQIVQTATEDNQIPVVFSAVSDPVGAGLVESMEAPGANITGTSDALNTNAILDLMLTANPDITRVGLLYSQSEDSSKQPIADAKAYLEEKGIEYVEKTGTNNTEVSQAADALIAAEVEAVFTPTDNTVMTAELAIYEKFLEAGIPHYAGADSFALNGAFCGYGVDYTNLGTATADMAVEILLGADPAETPVQTFDNGIATVNTETAEAIGIDYSGFAEKCTSVVETVTAEEFE
jgi:putative ABC transport system substrate-binding protein